MALGLDDTDNPLRRSSRERHGAHRQSGRVIVRAKRYNRHPQAVMNHRRDGFQCIQGYSLANLKTTTLQECVYELADPSAVRIADKRIAGDQFFRRPEWRIHWS